MVCHGALLSKALKVYLDSLEIGQVRKFLVELRAYLKTNKPQFKEIISSTKTFTGEEGVIGHRARGRRTNLPVREVQGTQDQ
ncbi:hypothetical protein K4H00_23255, partial [Mycobacterium tuberculosis]|nr:hypothetical protein [Mycobacterium tuberculosis]